MKKVVLLLSVVGVSAVFALSPSGENAGSGPFVPADPNPALGSIIHSFTITTSSSTNTWGINRDGAYVYTVMRPSGNCFLARRDASNGSIIATYDAGPNFTPRGEDVAHLGSGYLSVCDASNNRVRVIDTSNGSTVTSFAATSVGGSWPMNVLWNGQYYFVNGSSDRGTFNRYTTSGSSAGTWSASGWPSAMTSIGGAGYSTTANGQTGQYLVADSYGSGQPMCIIDMASGSLLNTWSTWSSNGQGIVCAPGVPSLWGNTAWVCWYNYSGIYKAGLQIDIGSTVSVAPTSVGKIRAIYR